MAGNVQEKQLRWYNIALMSFMEGANKFLI